MTQTNEHFELTASDVWQVKPSLTLSYGINFTYETPYRDINGKDYFVRRWQQQPHLSLPSF